MSEEDGVERARGREEIHRIQGPRGVGRKSRKTHLYRISLDGKRRYLGKRWRTAEASQYQDEIVDWLRGDSDHLLLEYEGDAVRVNVRSGAMTTIVKAPGLRSTWSADHTGAIRAETRSTDWNREESFRLRSAARGEWFPAIKFDPFTESGFWFAGFSPDPNRVLVYSNLKTDTLSLYEYDLPSARIAKRIAAHHEYDLDSGPLLLSRLDDRLLAIGYLADRLEYHVVDSDFAIAWESIEAAFPEINIWILSRSAKEDRWLLLVESDVRSPEVFLYDLASTKITHAFDLYPDVVNQTLVPTQALRYRARDGLLVSGYLTRPRHAVGPGPLILLPHDEGEGRDFRRFNPVVQYLVARGFSVFQPNYRGSSGYGSAYSRAGFGEWGGSMQEDLIDGVDALVRAGVADPARVGIFGMGYGGYAALHALTHSPGLFSAGASYGGIMDLESHIVRTGGLLGQDSVNDIVIGRRFRDRADLNASSPIRFVEDIKAPVLIAHGSEDPVVHERQLEQMTKALDRSGARFESIRYVGQIHSFLDERARIDFFSRLGDFFAAHLAADHDSQPAGPAQAPSESVRTR